MNCVLCPGKLTYKGRSVSADYSQVYYCDSCPMIYILIVGHEVNQMAAKKELVSGGRVAGRML